MRVLIYGGRDFVPTNDHVAFLNDIRTLHEALVHKTLYAVVSGGARGADTFGEKWAELCSIPVARYPADWKRHGKAAGHIRNQQMLDSGIDLAVQFPGGRGTADMRRRLDKAGVQVFEYPTDSTRQ